MTMSRRAFLRSGTLAGILPLVVPARPGKPPVVVRRDGLQHLALADFSAAIGTPFQASRNGTGVELTLSEVRSLAVPERPNEPRLSGESFVLIFSGPAAVALQQDTFAIEHRRLGNFDLLLVPGEETSERRLYSAVINRRMP
jgi:hypothetical protein